VTWELLIEVAYLTASVLFILGLRSLTKPEKARRGMNQAALGMLVAIIGTLLNHHIITYTWIITGLAIGAVAGYPLGMWVPMTAMPQRIAVSHMFGALAATLVGIAEYVTRVQRPALAGPRISHPEMAALGFEVLFGGLTISGSFMAFGKLQGFVTGTPVTWRGQNAVTGLLFATMLALFGYLVAAPGHVAIFYTLISLAFVFGFLLVLPIGGADMPVVVSLLNSYAGLASASTGFAIGNNVLIIAGALDGSSGFLLSMIMSKAMNRSFSNVLFGAFGGEKAAPSRGGSAPPVRAVSAEDAALRLAYARKVIVVPGYGMAVAQAQHQVRELAELIEKKGGEVKFAIHPVAGRMPGHMNVLLAEANVPYDKLYDMDAINAEFPEADVVLVIGANDVVNPAAHTDKGSPIYGMPILEAHKARSVIVLKRGMSTGFAGIENQLFHEEKTSMLFGDAKASLTKLVAEVKAA
jgi:NAD(P) transhydrogenase subunit beta